MSDPVAVNGAILAAGAILTGFCGSFLSFKLQREANYYRQPAVDFESEEAKDIVVDLTHFTSGFLLLILASLASSIFGVVFPLMGILEIGWFAVHPEVSVAGIVGSGVLSAAYFTNELIHYRILSSRLANDAWEWGREWITVVFGIVIATGSALLIALLAS